MSLPGMVRDFLGRVFNGPPKAETLADQEPVAVPADPLREIRLANRNRESVRDRQALTSILTDMTPQRLVSIFSEADNGYLGAQVELAQLLEERDGHIASLMQTRRLRVTSLEWSLSPGDESDDSKDCLTECRQWWDEFDLDSLVYDLLDAILAQYAIHRVIWDTADAWTPIGTREVDARRLVWPQSDSEGISPHVPRLMVNWDPGQFEDLQPGLHIAHIYRAKRGRPGKMALVRALAGPWLIKYFAIVDFAGLVEKWGRPFINIRYPREMTDAQVDALGLRLAKSLADGVIMLPEGSAAEVSPATAHITSLPQEALIKKMEDIQAKVILGNTTTSDAAQRSDDSRVTVTSAMNVAIRNADALAVARTIRRDLLVPWFAWNRGRFGAEAKPPTWMPVLDEDAAATLEFKRKVYAAFQSDGTVSDALVNATNLKELTRAVRLPVNEEYEEPYFPVRDRVGNLVSGEVIRDSENDIVGGGIIEGSGPVNPLGGAMAGRGEAETRERGDETDGEVTPVRPAEEKTAKNADSQQ